MGACSSREVFWIPRRAWDTKFNGVVTGNELWVDYRYQETFMCPSSGDEVPPLEYNIIATSEVMVTIHFRGVWLMTVDALDPNERFTQNDLVSFILSDLMKHAHICACKNSPSSRTGTWTNCTATTDRTPLTK
jgi:hypothetical protein